MGVTMLPRFAARVSSTTVRITSRSRPPAISSSVKGTRVISATSLVATMARKKHTAVSAAASPRWVRMRLATTRPIMSNTPQRRRPATTVISVKSISSVVVSIPASVCRPGAASRKDSSAAARDMVNTASLRKKRSTFFMQAASFPSGCAG